VCDLGKTPAVEPGGNSAGDQNEHIFAASGSTGSKPSLATGVTCVTITLMLTAPEPRVALGHQTQNPVLGRPERRLHLSLSGFLSIPRHGYASGLPQNEGCAKLAEQSSFAP